MAHTADGKAFSSIKSFSHHVVHEGSKTAVCGFLTEGSANEDAQNRNLKAKNLGIDAKYIVEPVSECTSV